MSSHPLDIRRESPGRSSIAGSPAPSAQNGHTRRVSIARLGSPIPRSQLNTPPIPQIPSRDESDSSGGSDQLLAIDQPGSLPGPGPSALSDALHSLPRLGAATPPRHYPATGLGINDRASQNNYGSFTNRDLAGSPGPAEDPEVVKRHLVQPEMLLGRGFGSPLRPSVIETGAGLDPDEFSSLRLQGGDITREIYRWAEEADGSGRGRVPRSKSFSAPRHEPEDETLDVHNILVPGGFRRNFLRRAADNSPAPSGRMQAEGGTQSHDFATNPDRVQQKPKLFTNNFLEFLTLYGHFAGEDLEEDDEALEPDEYFAYGAWDEDDTGSEREPGEDSALLTPGTPGRRRRKPKERAPTGTNSPTNAALLLLKSFVGTGVLFLPRAFLNGGMLFSSLVLLAIAALSFHAFILLVSTRLKVEASFGDMGGILYGKWMRFLILFSIVLSQIGFVAAYIVFTSENLQAFVLAVSKCKTFIDIKFMVLMQLIIFLPFSLIRDIGKLGFTALVADAFIMLGLIYLYYYDIFTIVDQGGLGDIKMFNPSSWTLLIGTAIFTFEGIGLIIPIQESMRHPEKFPTVLGIVMIIITVLFTSIGALSYAAYGSKTKTVVILNLPQDDKLVNGVQFLYSLAILLSTPLQLFPAIRIIENGLFTRSGKYNPYIKWKKNIFRFFFVLLCALIAWGGAGDLDKFASLVGSFACVPLVWVYPPLLHLKAVAKKGWQRWADYILCAFGVVACVYTTTLTITQWIEGTGNGGGGGGYCDKKIHP